MLGVLLGFAGAFVNFMILGAALRRVLQDTSSPGLFLGGCLLFKSLSVFLLLGVARYLSIKIVAQEVLFGVFVAAVFFIRLLITGKIFCFKQLRRDNEAHCS